MGSTKVKVFDDSAQVEEPKPKADKKKQKETSIENVEEVLLTADQEAGSSDITTNASEKPQPKADQSSDKKAQGKKPKKGQLKVRSKKYQEVMERIEKTKLYPLSEAIELAKETSFTKFPGTLEIHIGTSTKNVRGLVSLPFLSGKRVKILAFGTNADKSGADLVGDDAKLDDIAKGRIDFEALIATPAWMPKLARVAKILGPRGLMPNPKSGTVTDNLEKAVSEIQSGKVEYKSEANNPILHLAVGKLTQDSEELAQNIKALYLGIGKSKVKKMVISSTMGPGIKVDVATL